MFRYLVYGHTLLSDLPLTELEQVESGSSLGAIRIETGKVVDPDTSLRFECLWPSGARYFVSHGDGTQYVLDFPDVCKVAVNIDRWTVRVAPLPGVAPETIRHVLLDQVVPRLVAAAGSSVLHASAVETPVGTLAFLGEGGSGKSTLAAAFSASGDALVCDDALVVVVADGRPFATPGYPSLRLFSDAARQFFRRTARESLTHGTKKSSVRPPVVSKWLTPLRHVFVLNGEADETAPRLEPLGATDAFFALVQHSYRLDVRTAAILTRDTNLYADLASLCPVARLTVPDELGSLSSVRDWLLASLEPPAVCETATATL